MTFVLIWCFLIVDERWRGTVDKKEEERCNQFRGEKTQEEQSSQTRARVIRQTDI